MTKEEFLNERIDMLTTHVLRLQGETAALQHLLAATVLSLPVPEHPAAIRSLEAAADSVLASYDDAPVHEEVRAGAALAAASVLSSVRAGKA